MDGRWHEEGEARRGKVRSMRMKLGMVLRRHKNFLVLALQRRSLFWPYLTPVAWINIARYITGKYGLMKMNTPRPPR